jgi:hypothetical protein
MTPSETLRAASTYLYEYAVDVASENATTWPNGEDAVFDEDLYTVLLEEEASEILSYPDLDDLESLWRERDAQYN